jgi:hypothetical protein
MLPGTNAAWVFFPPLPPLQDPTKLNQDTVLKPLFLLLALAREAPLATRLLALPVFGVDNKYYCTGRDVQANALLGPAMSLCVLPFVLIHIFPPDLLSHFSRSVSVYLSVCLYACMSVFEHDPRVSF